MPETMKGEVVGWTVGGPPIHPSPRYTSVFFVGIFFIITLIYIIEEAT